jgi:hypothetical protein
VNGSDVSSMTEPEKVVLNGYSQYPKYLEARGRTKGSGHGRLGTHFGDVELTVISACSIAINADVELVGLWTMSDKVWLPGGRSSYSANKVSPDVEGEMEEFLRSSS